MLEKLRPYTKTVVAAIIGALQVLQVYVVLSANGMTSEDWSTLINSVILAIGGTGAVYQFPNKGSKS